MITKKELLYFSLKHQYLLTKTDKATVVSNLCGLQAQFANNPKYALQIRASDFNESDWGAGLIKVWSFRGTLHAVRRDELGLFLSARGVEDAWDDSWGIKKEIKPYWAERIYDWIGEGITSREALKDQCRAHGMEEELVKSVFHGWGGLIREMCNRGMIAYDIGTAKQFVICNNVQFMDQDEARIRLLKKYFSAFSPATLIDCAAFMGYKKSELLRLIELAGMPLQRIISDGTEYFYLNDLSGDGKIPDCLFLAGFDQLILGYRNRSRFMEDKNKRNVTTNTGIVFPTILLKGQLQAKWKKDKAKLLVTPFSTLSKRDKALITAKAKELFGNEVKDIAFLD